MKSTTCIAAVWLGVVALVSGTFADEPSVLEQIKKMVGAAKITLTQAIETAIKEVKGGFVIEAGLEHEDGANYFEVELFDGDKIREVKIDPRSGKVLGVEEEKPEDDEAEELAEARKALAGAKLTFAQAIAIAQKEIAGGTPLEAEIETEDGKPTYEITLLAGDKLMEVEIDAVSGKVIEVEEEHVPLAYWVFDKDAVSKAPDGWSFRETHPSGKKGVWKVVADTTSPTRPNVLELVTEAESRTFNLAIVENTALRDLDLRVRIRGNSGEIDQGGGLIWRCKDENNYYICRVNPLESNYRVYKVVDGKRTQLDSAHVETEAKKWYQVRAVMVGEKITCYLDGKKILAAKDDTFKDAGMFGLWTKADASSSFDNLAVYVRTGASRGENEHDDDDEVD